MGHHLMYSWILLFVLSDCLDVCGLCVVDFMYMLHTICNSPTSTLESRSIMKPRRCIFFNSVIGALGFHLILSQVQRPGFSSN